MFMIITLSDLHMDLHNFFKTLTGHVSDFRVLEFRFVEILPHMLNTVQNLFKILLDICISGNL